MYIYMCVCASASCNSTTMEHAGRQPHWTPVKVMASLETLPGTNRKCWSPTRCSTMRCEKTGLPSLVPPNPMVKFIISLWKIERIGHSLHKIAKTHPDLGIGSRHLGIAPAQMLWLVSGRLVDSANSCSQLPGEDSYSYWKSPQSQNDLLIRKLEAPLFKTGKNKIPAWSGTW